MKKILVWMLLSCTTLMMGQSQYEKGMSKAMELWGANKTTEAAQLFERIAKVEKDNWLPPFYVATIEIITSFGVKDEAVLEAKLKKAQRFLDMASANSQNNPEILITQALLHTAYIAFDGQRYGMLLSTKNTKLYEEALKLAPENPRVLLGKAEWDMGSAQFFGQPITPYCKDVEKALTLFDTEKVVQFYPKWGKERALEVMKKCKVTK